MKVRWRAPRCLPTTQTAQAKALRFLVNEAAKIERAEHCAPKPHEHTSERYHHANGYKPKTVLPHVGELTFAQPQTAHCVRLRTTNALQRIDRELKRRTRGASIFRNAASCLRRVAALDPRSTRSK